MKALKQFSIILLILSIGQAVQNQYNLFIPGTILGMVLLLFLLLIRVLKLKWIEKISNTLLENISILFVPINVGIIVFFNDMREIWMKILIISIISTIVVMGVTGLTVQFMERLLGKKEKEGNI